MRFSQYMEQYRSNLTDASILEELLQEAKHNHRVQKLLTVYIMKDQRTFNDMVRLATKDPFAHKLVAHAMFTIKTFTADQKRKPIGKSMLFKHLERIAKAPLDVEDIVINQWELDGYYRVLNSYLVYKKVFTPKNLMRNRKKMESVEWDNMVSIHD